MRPQDTFCFTGKTVDWVFSQLQRERVGHPSCIKTKIARERLRPDFEESAQCGAARALRSPENTLSGQRPRVRVPSYPPFLHLVWLILHLPSAPAGLLKLSSR